jgi:hypothetical protein
MARNGQQRDSDRRIKQTFDRNFDDRGIDSDFGQDGGRYNESLKNKNFVESDSYRNEDRGMHFGKGPKGWKRSDENIKEEASGILYQDSELDASEISLTVKDGCIYLKGTVDSRDAKRRAERSIEKLSGVDDVQNELKVKRDLNSNFREINQESLS